MERRRIPKLTVHTSQLGYVSPSCFATLGADWLYDVDLQGIVFASYNYRLSLWGFPHSSELSKTKKTQNFGLLDTRAAVEWLHANVRRFGGDPKKITLGGTYEPIKL